MLIHWLNPQKKRADYKSLPASLVSSRPQRSGSISHSSRLSLTSFCRTPLEVAWNILREMDACTYSGSKYARMHTNNRLTLSNNTLTSYLHVCRQQRFQGDSLKLTLAAFYRGQPLWGGKHIKVQKNWRTCCGCHELVRGARGTLNDTGENCVSSVFSSSSFENEQMFWYQQ
jgi:hypothetical protein